MRLHPQLFLVLGALWLATARAADAQDKTAALPVMLQRASGAGVLGPLQARKTPIVAAAERARGAVVNIQSERPAPAAAPADFFTVVPSSRLLNGMGTGIIIDPRGYIVTNHHVVEDVISIRIRLADGTQHNATVVARSPEMDLALLKVDASKPLPTITLGTATDLMVGEKVIAIGNAYGYEHTVSEGIVSALKRDVSLNDKVSYKQLIQTDAPINPGNSGGPLLNANGELVGVNVAIRAGAQGIGFAIPVDNMIRTVADMLRARRRFHCADGLACRDRLDRVGDSLVRTVIVERIEGQSPAGQAGLRAGDAIVQVGATAIACSYDVERALLDRKAGDQVPLIVRRQGQEQRLDLALAAVERNRSAPGDLVWQKLGLQLAPVEADTVTRVNRQLHGGMEVIAINNDSPASKAGIRKGDILVGLHQWETVNLENIAYVLGHPDLAAFGPLNFYVLRAGQIRQGKLGPVN